MLQNHSPLLTMLQNIESSLRVGVWFSSNDKIPDLRNTLRELTHDLFGIMRWARKGSQGVVGKSKYCFLLSYELNGSQKRDYSELLTSYRQLGRTSSLGIPSITHQQRLHNRCNISKAINENTMLFSCTLKLYKLTNRIKNTY